MPNFLFELGLEEIPARMIASAEAELGKRVGDLLARERLSNGDARINTYSTPRRLAILAEGIFAAQADTEENGRIPIEILSQGDDLGWSWLFAPWPRGNG